MRRGAIVVLALALGATGCTDSSEPAATTARASTANTPATVATTTSLAATTTTVAVSTTSTSPPTTTSTTLPSPALTLALPSIDSGTWDSWSTTNDVRVQGLAVGPDGDIWAITHGGLVHWETDGGYTEVSDPEWPDPQPHSIALTPNGDLWLGFHIDVIQITPSGNVRHEFTPTSDSWSGIEFAVGPDGDIWTAASQFGVHRFDGNEWQAVVTDLPGRGDLDSFAVDSAGQLWMGSYWSGLWAFDGDRLRQETGRTTRVVQADREGGVWYKVDDGRGVDVEVVHVDLATEVRTSYPLPPANVWDIAPVNGAAYIGTNPSPGDGDATHGLWLLEGGEAISIPGSWDAPQRQVLAVEVDAEGAVWLGGQMGVWRYDGQTERQYLTDTFDGFSVGFITPSDGALVWSGDCQRSSTHSGDQWRALPAATPQLFGCDTAIDSRGRFWVAGDEGIARLDEDRWVVDRHDAAYMPWVDLYPPCNSEACDDPRWSLAAGTDVWAGMIGVRDGLWRYEGDGWRRMPAGLPDGAGPIVAIAPGSDGTLWVAAKNGVYHLDQGGWASYPSGEEGPPENLQAIAVGEDKVWVRGYWEVAVLDDGIWTSFTLPDRFWDPRILLVDPEGAVWMPSESGTARFDGTVFTDLELPGNPYGYAQAMAIDTFGAWWIAAGGRLYRWTP